VQQSEGRVDPGRRKLMRADVLQMSQKAPKTAVS
jgi:hypothetical protein